MDAQSRINLLLSQIDEARDGEPLDFDAWKAKTRATLRATLGEGNPIVSQFDQVSFSLMMWTDTTPDSAFAKARRSGVLRAVALLRGAIHEIEISEPRSPELDPEAFHPWIAGAVTGLWDSGHLRQAVDEATRAVEIRCRSKLGGIDMTGTPLMTEAFNPAPPKPGGNRLRFPGLASGSRAWTNAHEGAMHFGMGCMMRIRNLIEHHEEDLDRREALESLAALSLLARWIDAADVEERHES